MSRNSPTGVPLWISFGFSSGILSGILPGSSPILQIFFTGILPWLFSEISSEFFLIFLQEFLLRFPRISFWDSFKSFPWISSGVTSGIFFKNFFWYFPGNASGTHPKISPRIPCKIPAGIVCLDFLLNLWFWILAKDFAGFYLYSSLEFLFLATLFPRFFSVLLGVYSRNPPVASGCHEEVGLGILQKFLQQII